ncbi:MAG: terminase small subunit [Vicinamibacterales bacterium]
MNARERAFVAAFLGPAHGVAYKAAIMAGYAKNSARVTASRLLTKANIQRAIETQTAKRDARAFADAEERDRILSAIARDQFAAAPDRIRSIVELNRWARPSRGTRASSERSSPRWAPVGDWPGDTAVGSDR